MSRIPFILIHKGTPPRFVLDGECTLEELLDRIDTNPSPLYQFETREEDRTLLKGVLIYRDRESFKDALSRHARAQL